MFRNKKLVKEFLLSLETFSEEEVKEILSLINIKSEIVCKVISDAGEFESVLYLEDNIKEEEKKYFENNPLYPYSNFMYRVVPSMPNSRTYIPVESKEVEILYGENIKLGKKEENKIIEKPSFYDGNVYVVLAYTKCYRYNNRSIIYEPKLCVYIP